MGIEIKWWWMCSLSELYQFTLEPEFVDHKDRQEIFEFLQKSEGIRPEDINGVLQWINS